MPRPDLTSERKPHIIAAAKRAIARYGIAGATQERIAEEAGMSRPHVRHYAGNRDDVLDAVWEATMQTYVATVHSAAADPTSVDAVEAFLRGSFVYEEDDEVVVAFIAEGRRDDGIRRRTRQTYDRIEADVGRIVRGVSPGISEEEVASRAYAFMVLLVGAASLDLLRPDEPRGEGLVGMARQLLRGEVR
ncbi:MAG: TetR/AcrR family transcriptional regulator [Actinobacteria bacterium]|nr:TetR/AcrR family transcriptional regulator [Actinomycetota bacterium]